MNAATQLPSAALEAIRAATEEDLKRTPPLTPEVKDRIASALRPRPAMAGEAR